MKTPLVLLSVLAVVCAAGIAMWILKLTVCRKSRGMAKLAKELGLPLMGSEKNLLGIERGQVFILDIWRGRELNIHHVVREAGGRESVSSALEVPVNVPADLKMNFTATGWLTQAALAQGLDSVRTGNENFDRLISMRATDVAVARAALSPQMCALFVKTWIGCDVRDSLSVREGRIHYEEPGLIHTAAKRRRFAAMAALCHDLATALDKGHLPEQPQV
jgi:hypothetical protein